jgi:hypothetical protein
VPVHPNDPDRLYQQNHHRHLSLDRPADRWVDIGASMPKSVGSIGFPMTLHPRDADTLWVFPMDGLGCLAAHFARGEARRVTLGEWRQDVGSASDGSSEGASLVDGEAPSAASDAALHSGRLLRDDSAANCGKPRRGPGLECVAQI